MEYGLKRLGRELVYPGKVLNFYKDTMELPDGHYTGSEMLFAMQSQHAAYMPHIGSFRIRKQSGIRHHRHIIASLLR